jgi:SAM-dependent methyltransferase
MPRTRPFDEHADAYDAWFEENRDLYEAELEAVRQLMPPPGGDWVEVGVGSGMFAAPLGVTLGVEPSAEMADRARRRGITVRPGVAEALPLPDAAFDLVLMVTTICFVDDVDASFREARRVLKPGGSLLVGFVDRESELGRRYERMRESSAFYRDAVFFSTGDVLARLDGAGFGETAAVQTLVPGDEELAVTDGHGRGAFVVVRAVKREPPAAGGR